MKVYSLIHCSHSRKDAVMHLMHQSTMPTAVKAEQRNVLRSTARRKHVNRLQRDVMVKSVNMSVDECCRFCHKNLKRKGTFEQSMKIFSTPYAKTVFDRLIDLGLTLTRSPEKSIRTCRKCTNILSRLERDLLVFRRWEDEEKQSDSSEQTSESTAADQSNVDPPVSKMPKRKVPNKFWPNPPAPNQTRISGSARRSITEVSIL